LLITTILGYWQRWAWIELLWRWLELLIIPVALAAGALWFNRQERRAQNAIETRRQESAQALALEERENDRDIAADRAREDALQRYLDRMSELILDKNLRESNRDDASFRVGSISLLPGDAVRATARARTFTVLRSLDGNRKGEVVRFLYEADLIGNAVLGERLEAIVDLQLANLRGANLVGTNLRGANLRTVLMFANLAYAKMSDADLQYANLRGANLREADLREADLEGANLSHVYLRGARNWTNEQLAQAESLVGATLPDGTKMTEEGWEEFKKRYR
jgi:uncharacterized protein YjbI with pentapeptide repeats